jgi:hypothetical protein
MGVSFRLFNMHNKNVVLCLPSINIVRPEVFPQMHCPSTAPAQQHACFLEIYLFSLALFVIIRAAVSALGFPMNPAIPTTNTLNTSRHWIIHRRKKADEEDDDDHDTQADRLVRHALAAAYWNLLANKARALYYTKRTLKLMFKRTASSPASTGSVAEGAQRVKDGKRALRKRWTSMDDMWARSAGR